MHSVYFTQGTHRSDVRLLPIDSFAKVILIDVSISALRSFKSAIETHNLRAFVATSRSSTNSRVPRSV